MIVINSVNVTGRIVKDPDIKYGQNNNCFAGFSLAVRRKFHKDNEPDSDFFNVKAFGKTAEFIEKNGKKGIKFEISGRLQQDRWTDKDGQNHTAISIVADSIEFAESRASSQNQGNQQSASKPQTAPSTDNSFMDIPEGDFDKLPFN